VRLIDPGIELVACGMTARACCAHLPPLSWNMIGVAAA
jgi:hypothetical protein